MDMYEKPSGSPEAPTEMRWSILPERMPAIPLEQLTPEQAKVCEEIASGPRGSVRGPFVAMLRSAGLASRMQKLGEFIRFECKLDPRAKVVAGLLVARQWTTQYLWNGHLRQAREAGMSQALVDAIAEGRRPPEMSDVEEAAYELVTELFATRGVSDTTYAKAVKALGEQGVIEIVGVAGYFSINSMIMNVARTPLRDGGKPKLAALPKQFTPIADE
jgi:4-carboxymuconolactone decarboxylase